MQNGQLLTRPTKNQRLLNSTKLLNKLKYPKENNIIWFFLDKKKFLPGSNIQQAAQQVDCYLP